MNLTPSYVAKALNLPSSPNDTPYTAVVTDSRKIQKGCLFVALKGEKFDGHDFVQQAIEKGATGVIVEKNRSAPQKHAVKFEVPDTLTAYRQLAAKWRAEFKIPVIAVAGSMGKTTTKELLAAILKAKWPRLLKTQGSQNGFIGIPMTLLELRPEHEAAVIEIGIDDVNTMGGHLEIVRPTAAILTAIGPEHLEKLQSIERVAQEECEILTFVGNSGGKLAINLDDPYISPHASRHPNAATFSLQNPQALYRGQTDGAHLHIQGPEIHTSFTLPLPGRHNASNLLGAIAVAMSHGVTAGEIHDGLTHFQGAEGRSQLRKLPGNIQAICDYYNANPPSMTAGLALLAQIAATTGRKWACLGDMLELGKDEERFHLDLAKPILENQVDQVLLYGPRMTNLEKALKSSLFNGSFKGKVQHFPTHEALATVLTEEIQPGDTVLIKGSRSMKMEEVWKILEKYANSHPA